MHAKETILRNLDSNFERLCSAVDETVHKDIDNLLELEESMKREIQKLENILEEGQLVQIEVILHFLL